MNQELERFEPASGGGRISYEHLHRYAICRDRVVGQRVLDVACGEGYGSNLLAKVAAEVTGLDIDPKAIDRAKKRFRAENLKFVTADCCEMPFEEKSFDFVVANEMIEHIPDHGAFIEEVKRILAPGGMLLVSTPNKPVYNRYKTPNPFHVSEMDIPEFRDLLERHFKHVHLTGLRMALVSAGFDIDGVKHHSNLATAKTYRGLRTGEARPEVSNDELSFEDPEYVLATCSDREIEEASAPSTIFFSSEDDLWLEHEKVMAWASQLHEEDELLRADLRNSREDVESLKSDLEEEKRRSRNRQHVMISSRLLGRMTGSQVEPDEIAIIDALFSLNEQMITQRARVEGLEAAERRALELEEGLQNLRATGARLANELETVRGERDGLASDINDRDAKVQLLESEFRTLSEELARLKKEAENATALAKRELERSEEKLKHSTAELERSRHELARAKSELDAIKKTDGSQSEESARNLTGRPASAGLAAASQGRRSRQQARLVASHREIHEQLRRSHDSVRGSLPAAPPARRTLSKRLARSSRASRILFDRAWVERQVPEAGRIAVRSFLKDPSFRHIDPHPLFSTAYYLNENPDVAEAGVSPFEHYLEHGWREGRNPHPYFANDWYLHNNPDVARAGVNPLVHYVEHGWKEGRRPNPVFDPLAYLAKHVDVEAGGMEPLTHFVMYGRDEDRTIPFLGVEREWRELVGENNSRTLMDHLLSEPTERAQATSDIGRAMAIEGDENAWPPAPLNDFWVPQVLRDLMIERHWEGLLPLYTYIYSVMDAYADDPDSFPQSDACARILDRARKLSLELANSDRPSVSIIIPAYNNVLDTILCIVSLLETKPTRSFEIIVADDCSSDATELLIPKIGGLVHHFRNSENLGFLGNCNAAAERARGQTIVLLNNDTLALPGWLENLVTPFERFDRVGMVGSKLINWDGRLQEAGGIFWKDGSAWNFGRGQNVTDPEFNYLKDVDYCSGASIAIPSKVWRKVGGFDPSFAPAYCEDSDLAFRIREAGFRVLYSPHSELIHHEGRTHGRDTAAGIKAYQVTNQQRLLDRWSGVLERDNFPNGENVLRARDRSSRKPHILVIDHYVPQIDKDAGSRTMFQFLEALSDEGWAITFWPENLYYDPNYTRALQHMGVEVIYGPKYVGKFPDFLRTRHDLYDAVLLSRPHVAVHFINDVRTLSDARVLYYGHDVHFERMKAQLEVAHSTMEEDAVQAMRTLELGVCNRCDVILYPSEDEARLMSDLVVPRVRSLSIPAYRYSDVEIQESAKTIERISHRDERPARLLFVGGFAHGPNVDGISWFSREVAPLLREEGFDFDLQIVGSNPTAEVWDLEGEDTHVRGFVSDEELLELYRSASVVIAPLRFGAGVKGKVVEAMARGVPVVTTQVGAQGISGAEDCLFLGNTPEEFAAAIRDATDAQAAKAKAECALNYIRSHYSRRAMIKVFKQVLPSAHSASKAA
jgi:GT2 family glycosyltransferase/SAM-dependent methyltransferase